MAVPREITDSAKDAQKWAQGRWSDFRSESPFFQAKVGLVVAYVVVVLLTLFLAPPRGADWVVSQERINFGLSFKTALHLKSNRAGDFDKVVVEVDGAGIEFDGRKKPGTWRTKPMSLVEGKEARIQTEQLFDARGSNPPYSLVIESVRVIEGKDVVVTLHPAPAPTATAAP